MFMLIYSLCFTAGCSSLWAFKTLPFIPYAKFFILFTTLFSLLLQKHWKKTTCLLVFLTGFFYCDYIAFETLQKRVPNKLEGLPLPVTGIITALPESTSHGTSHFEFLITKLPADIPWQLPVKIRLSWYQHSPLLHAGETWRFSVKLKQPRSTFNPDSFDYEAWLFTHRLNAIGYVVEKAPNQLLSTSPWHHPINTLREKIQSLLESHLSTEPNLGLIEALTVGVRDHLSQAQWQIMQATGTNHLVAIAGLHIGFVSAFILAITQFIWRRLPLLMLYMPAQEASILVALVGTSYYSALSGFALPAQRALIMLSVGLISTLLRRNLPPWHAYGLALLSILVFDPLSVFSESFWLSFVAVALILFALQNKKMVAQPHILQSIYIQGIIAFGLAPLTLYFFHKISLINIIANGIAIPWVGVGALPLIFPALLLFPFSTRLAQYLWWLAAKALGGFWSLLGFFASLNRLQTQLVLNHTGCLILAMLGIFVSLAPIKFYWRFAGLLLLLPLFLGRPPPIHHGEIIFTLLDVGQGLSTLIQTQHHQLLFDAGPAFDAISDMGASVGVPTLLAKNIKKLDMMIISHADNDHSGGAMAILQNYPVKLLLTSAYTKYQSLPTFFPQQPWEADKSPLQQVFKKFQSHWVKPELRACIAGQHWEWDGIEFSILSPPPNYSSRKTNDLSCVLKISNPYHSILLTGDIEKPTEKRLVSQLHDKLRAEILVAPHHGSKSSSIQEFVDAISPQIVLYGTGYRNKFHFPNTIVVDRYNTLGAHQYTTAQSGQINIVIPATSNLVSLMQARDVNAHFWNYVGEHPEVEARNKTEEGTSSSPSLSLSPLPSSCPSKLSSKEFEACATTASEELEEERGKVGIEHNSEIGALVNNEKQEDKFSRVFLGLPDDTVIGSSERPNFSASRQITLSAINKVFGGIFSEKR